MKKADISKLSTSGLMAVCGRFNLPTPPCDREAMIASLNKVDVSKVKMPDGLFLQPEEPTPE